MTGKEKKLIINGQLIRNRGLNFQNVEQHKFII